MPPHATAAAAVPPSAPKDRDAAAAATMSTQQPGERSQQPYRVGSYVIREEIGRGSFATVFRGEKTTTSPPTPVAIKAVVRSKLTVKLLENLESEIRLLRGIRQRNVVELLDCLKTSSHIYLVMAFCASGDLSQHIRKAASSKNREADRYPAPKEGGLHEKVVRCFLGQLAEALKFLRDKDIIHRDIKPQNLLLHPASAEDIAAGHPEGIPLLQVADFGFARALPATSLAETLCGSPLYMAPEILRYQKYDAKADLWSVGAVLYECCTGKPPFRAQNHVELLRRIERGQDRIKWPEDKKEEEGREPVVTPRPIPNDIKELVNGLLRQNPVERMSFQEFFAKADEVARWGEGSLVAPGTIADRPVSTTDPTSRTHSRQASSTDVTQLAQRAETRAVSPTAQALVDPLPPPSSAAEQEPAFTRPAPPVHTPSSRASGTATPADGQQAPALVQRRSFAPKYIVGGGAAESAAPRQEIVQVKTRDFAVVTTAPTPVTPFSPERGQPTRQPSRRNSGQEGNAEPASRAPQAAQPKSGIALALPSHLTATRHVQSAHQQDLAISGITGDGDSVLGREYVVVEKRNVEVNALADEMAAQNRRTSTIGRRNSRGFLSRQPSSYTSTSPIAIGGADRASGASPSPPIGSMPYPPTAGAHAQAAVSEPPPFARAATHTYGSSPRARSNTSTTYYSYSSSPGRYTGLATAAPAATATAALAIVGTGSQAIVKALNMASLKLFGSPSENIWLRKRSHRKPIERSYGSNASALAEEERLMDIIEDIAQKATVIFDFADSKVILMTNLMASSAERSATPQGLAINASQTNPFFSNVVPKARRSSSSSSTERPVMSPLAQQPVATSPGLGQQSGTHTPANMPSFTKPEHLPGETLVLYLKALAFLQKGIELAREHVSNLPPGRTASSELNEYVQWFRSRFNECFDKAEWAKSRLVGDIPDSAMLAERLIFDRSLELSRAAAVSELKNENPSECEIAYETALWMLYAILDETMQEGEPVGEEDKVHVQNFVTSIKGRLDALRRKIPQTMG